MRTNLACLAVLLLTLAPATVSEATPPVRTPRAANRVTPALAHFQSALLTEGRDLREHGVYIESLNTSEPLAAINADVPMNPASVIKLATSLAALEALGVDLRFRTEFLCRGEIDKRTGVLQGDLVLSSGADPSFSIPDARSIGDALRNLGVRRVTGNLVIAGTFNCNYNTQTDVSAAVFRRQSRLAINGSTLFEPLSPESKRGELLLTLESEPLLKIIYYQNAHSVNAMAELLSERVGGPEGVRRFVVERLGLDPESVFISRGSGLDFNRLSARGTVALLRSLVGWLEARGLTADSVMPIAGVDASTLSDRFSDERFEGSIVGKTGTLHESDGGVAALAGIAYTRKSGPVLFAVFDMAEGRRVEHLRQLQDAFLKATVDELGGPRSLSFREDRRQIPAPAGRLIIAPQPTRAAG
ncbi:MAG: D-alanyl-D-alanine carboxypeptidase [Acidobacteriota bacterium]